MINSIFRSKLNSPTETVALLTKVAAMYAKKASRVVFSMEGGDRFGAQECTNVAFDPSAADDQIAFQRPGGSSVEYYNISDIYLIKRLRTKKYMIKIKAGALPAQATV